MHAFPHFGVVDIGNSGMKATLAESSSNWLIDNVISLCWKLHDNQAKSPPREFLENGTEWALPTDVDAIGQILERVRSKFPTLPAVHWRVSSVQPNALIAFQEALSNRFPRDTCSVISFQEIPMECKLDDPGSVGVDRLLAAWGAWQANDQSGPLIVIQAGTAVTIDWVDELGAYCGGAIMPGMTLTLKYLALGTAQLPWLAPTTDPEDVPLPGKNTREAILAGVTASFVGGVRLLQDRYRKQFLGDASRVQTFVSGGDGTFLSRIVAEPYKKVDHLVLAALAKLPLATTTSS